MRSTGNLLKMRSEVLDAEQGPNVTYYLPLGSEEVAMNRLVGREISIEYLDKINCIHCGRETSKSFSQGYCYPCFVSLPQTDECILHPQKCQAHLGISRDMAWSEKNCLTHHIVYLALTPSLKVGVTRESQVPVRWVDQGAWEAIRIARTPNRYTAGLIEVALKAHLADKTNWRAMLSGHREGETDLVEQKNIALNLLNDDLREFAYPDSEIVRLDYPVIEYPAKVKALNLDSNPKVAGRLEGIKGQYLIFSDGGVLNIRKYGGYLINFDC